MHLVGLFHLHTNSLSPLHQVLFLLRQVTKSLGTWFIHKDADNGAMSIQWDWLLYTLKAPP